MTNKILNRVKMTVSGTPGTGTITLGSAVAGFQSMSGAGVSNSDTVPYVIEDGSSWELGVGTYTSSGTTLSRSVTASSNSGNPISATSGAIVFVTPLAADLQSGTAANNLVRLDGSSKLPAVDGSALTGVVASSMAASGLTGTLGVAHGGTGLTSLGTGVATAIGNAVNGASGICVQDASGNLGLGVTPSAWYVGGSTKALTIGAGGYTSLSTAYGGDGNLSSNAYLTGASTWSAVISAGASRYQVDFGAHRWFTASSGSAGAAISFTQAMTLDANSNLLIGTTDTGFSSGNGIKLNPSGNTTSVPYIAVVGNSASSSHFCYTLRSTSNSTWRFYVDYAGTVFAQSTTITSLSDARHKENIRELDQGLEAILALKPRRFDWKEGKGNGKKNVAGFVAQEVEPIFPDLIAPFKDDDTPDLKGLAMGGMLPAVVKAIQELAAEVAMLKGQLNG